ncbi:hypothetical protein AVO41_00060 [Thiomicrospira sp. WB1]|nr:hypothetical protein AVO41_00060 [Thiomicrospira sp. WB1]
MSAPFDSAPVGPADPIEPLIWPMDPGVDWAQLIVWLGWGLLGLVFILAWWLWRRRFAPLARWQRQAARLQAQWQATALPGERLADNQRWQLYALFQSAPYLDATSESHQRLQSLCFSREPVSRETLEQALEALQQAVMHQARSHRSNGWTRWRPRVVKRRTR